MLAYSRQNKYTNIELHTLNYNNRKKNINCRCMETSILGKVNDLQYVGNGERLLNSQASEGFKSSAFAFFDVQIIRFD